MTDKSGLPDGQEFFKLNEVCKLANVQPYMLRFWGSEFPELEASRSETGQRLYDRGQVEVILEIRRLLFDEGLTIAGTRKRINAMRDTAKSGGASGKAKGKTARAPKTKKPEPKEKKPAKAAAPPDEPEATPKKVDKPAPDRVKPLLAALKEVRTEVSRIVAELKDGAGESA